MCPELKTLEWDILNPDHLINLEINNKRRTSLILSGELEKVISSELKTLEFDTFNPDRLINLEINNKS